MTTVRKGKRIRHDVNTVVVDTFSNAQNAPGYQQDKYIKILLKFMKEDFTGNEAEEKFTAEFASCLIKVLLGSYSEPFVKKMVTFTAHFLAMQLKEEAEYEREESSYFTNKIFETLFEMVVLDDKNIRFNSCSLLNQLLSSLAEHDVPLDDNICGQIMQVMISERICDKVTFIREEAVKVLQWLQDETNPSCRVTRTLLFHMNRDVSSEMRRLILKSIRVSSVTLPSIVKRMRDVKENIRVDAYKILADRRKMTSLSFATREQIIMSGLRDESDAVRSAVESYLLPRWLEQLEGGILQFVKELDVESHPTVPKMVLPHLFKTKKIQEIIAPLAAPANEKFIPMENLTPALALYWSCIAKYLCRLVKERDQKQEAEEALDKIVPTVVELCNYIGMVFDAPLPSAGTPLRLAEDEAAESKRVSTLVFLLELFDSCDLSDEGSRKCMNQLLERILRSQDCVHQQLIICATKQLSIGYTDPIQRVNVVLSIVEDIHKPLISVEKDSDSEVQPVLSEYQRREHQVQMAQIRVALCRLQVEQEKAIEKQDFLRAEQLKVEINEQRMELKQKEEDLNTNHVQSQDEVEMVRKEIWSHSVVLKCLTIVLQLMKEEEVFVASIGLVDLVENFVQKCFAIDNSHVMSLAVEIAGIYCLQRLANAKSLLQIFYFLLNNDLRPYDDVRAVCVKCICAIMVHHGFHALEIPANEPVFLPEKNRLNASVKPELGYISNITFLLDDPVLAVRNQATIGLCKLVLSGKIVSIPLLSRLILLWFNPANSSNKTLMRILGQFFSVYPTHYREAPKTLIATLLPTIDLLLEAPHTSPLLEIEPKDIGLFILDLARPGRNKYYTENAHDKMGYILLERIIDEPAGDAIQLFLRLCINLQLSLDVDEVRRNLLTLAKRIKREQPELKSKDLKKLIESLHSSDDTSSQDSSILLSSQISQEPSENALPANHTDVDSELMDLDETLVPETPLKSKKRVVRRSKRSIIPPSDTDSD